MAELTGLSIIIPTYNEKENIPFLIYMIVDTLKNVKFPYEILLIDDNSPDGTLRVYRKLQELFPDVQLKEHQRRGKLGLGSAYIDGLKYTKYDFILIMDADLSHHPKYILDMINVQKISKCDIVSGTRYAPGGGASGWDLKRVFISKCANFLAQFLLRPKFSDLTGSFRLYRRNILESVIKDVKGKGYIFQMEIAIRAEKQFKAKVAEVPIIFIERIYGESKLWALEALLGILKINVL